MSRLYKRKISAIVGNSQRAIELSPLRCVFEIHQWELQTPNNVRLTVYNPAPATVHAAESEFTRVVIQAGYEDGPFGTIFEGTIIQAFAGRENATDTYLQIIGSDGDAAYNFGVVAKALASGATTEDEWKAIAEAMTPHGVVLGYLPSDLPKRQLPRGKVMFGMARDFARELAESGEQSWSIQNGKLQVIPKDGYLPGPAIVLTAKTGLVGLPQRTQEGIRLRCLLNPELAVGRAIQLDNRSVQDLPLSTAYRAEATNLQFLSEVRLDADGFYRVLAVDHVGDSRGSDWYSDVTAIALRDPPPLTQVQKGR
jgi:hypothetical protein